MNSEKSATPVKPEIEAVGFRIKDLQAAHDIVKALEKQAAETLSDDEYARLVEASMESTVNVLADSRKQGIPFVDTFMQLIVVFHIILHAAMEIGKPGPANASIEQLRQLLGSGSSEVN